MLARVWLLIAVRCAATSSPICEPGVDLPKGDLPGMPLDLPDSAACLGACEATKRCNLFTFHPAGCTYGTYSCNMTQGCCWLKKEVNKFWAPAVNNCSCSAHVRVPEQPATPSPRRVGRNLLYILVDDLRPELAAYGQGPERSHSPHMKRLADTGMVFDNAHCQIAVCSPSRNSILTGRRPDHSRIYNFIDHFRQADCGKNLGGQALEGEVLRDVRIDGCGWPGQAACGGSGQCCSICTEQKECMGWTYRNLTRTCRLFTDSKPAIVFDPGAVSGVRGTFDTRASWTSLPQHFKQNGWLTLSSGKVFHTEEGAGGSSDAAKNGPGMPPNMDPQSWSEGLSMSRVNAVAPCAPCDVESSTCAVNAELDGTILHPKKQPQFCDRIIADDAVLKLRLAAKNLAETGQNFFMAAGFRKPHLPFRFPKPFLSLLPAENLTDLPLHPTMHSSVPAIAHHFGRPQFDPYAVVHGSTARWWRLHYRAAIAWVDSQIGRVLTELENLNLAGSTMVVLHSDHGFGLGEHGAWQKFTNFEHGTRVPLIMRVPWLPQSGGKRSGVLAELVDVFPTMAEAMGVPMQGPEADSLDGTSLLPVLERPDDVAVAQRTKQFALSLYPRCPQGDGTPGREFWRNNDCLLVDRSQISHMGYTLRTQDWRYTEWVRWDGSVLEPDWSEVVGRELYSHAGDDGRDPDAFENRNEEMDYPDVVSTLSAWLRSLVGNQTRLPPAMLAI